MRWRPLPSFLLALTVLPIFSASLKAQEDDTAHLTIDRAVALTLERNPALARAGWTVEGLKAGASQAGRWSNPELQFELEEFGIDRGWGDKSDYTISVTQTIPLSPRKGRESGLLLAEAREAEASGQVSRLATLTQLHKAFHSAVAAKLKVDIQQDAYGIAEQAFEAVRLRIEAGAIPPAEIERAQAELLTAELELENARAAHRTALASLSRFWDGDPAEVVGVQGKLVVPDSLALHTPESVTVHDQLVKARDDRGRKLEALEQARAVPDLTVGLGFRGIAAFQENALVFSLSMPLPVLDRNADAVDKARALRRAGGFDARHRRSVLRTSLAVCQTRLQAAQKRHRSIVTSLLPAVERAYESIQIAFAEGRFGTLDLLEARRHLVETRFLALEAALEFNLLRADAAYFQGDFSHLIGGGHHD